MSTLGSNVADQTSKETSKEVLASIRQQVEYYFSAENLSRDQQLVSELDSDNWILMSRLLSFPRLRDLTSSVNVLIEAMKESSLVEVDVTKGRMRPCNVRRRTTVVIRVPEKGLDVDEAGIRLLFADLGVRSITFDKKYVDVSFFTEEAARTAHGRSYSRSWEAFVKQESLLVGHFSGSVTRPTAPIVAPSATQPVMGPPVYSEGHIVGYIVPVPIGRAPPDMVGSLGGYENGSSVSGSGRQYPSHGQRGSRGGNGRGGPWMGGHRSRRFVRGKGSRRGGEWDAFIPGGSATISPGSPPSLHGSDFPPLEEESYSSVSGVKRYSEEEILSIIKDLPAATAVRVSTSWIDSVLHSDPPKDVKDWELLKRSSDQKKSLISIVGEGESYADTARKLLQGSERNSVEVTEHSPVSTKSDDQSDPVIAVSVVPVIPPIIPVNPPIVVNISPLADDDEFVDLVDTHAESSVLAVDTARSSASTPPMITSASTSADSHVQETLKSSPSRQSSDPILGSGRKTYAQVLRK